MAFKKGNRAAAGKGNCFKHGLSKTPMYKLWVSMIQRCENQKAVAYKWYGARGIKVCKQWRESFLQFLQDMGERPSQLSLDRIDNSGDYEPKNCRWATAQQQSDNKRYS